MYKLKLPRGFNKMTLAEQEEVLVNNLNAVYELEKKIKIALGSIRGGNRIITSDPRPDEALLKA